jgi:hypothetical protein
VEKSETRCSAESLVRLRIGDSMVSVGRQRATREHEGKTLPKNENEKKDEQTPETEAVVATADLSLLDEDALMAYNFMAKAVAEAERLSVGSESESDTLARVFEDAAETATKSEILTLVATARENVPDEETVKAGLAKAVKRYQAGLLAWESEDTPEGFVIPQMPKTVKSGGSATGRGAGVPRPRGLRAATPEHGLAELKNKEGYLTCATLAQKIGDGLTTATLFDAWKSVAGEDSESWNEAQSETVEVKGKEKTHKVTFYYTKG